MTLGHAVVTLLTLDLGGDISRWYRLMEEQKCQNTSNDRYRRNSLLIIRRGTTIKDALIKSQFPKPTHVQAYSGDDADSIFQNITKTCLETH